MKWIRPLLFILSIGTCLLGVNAKYFGKLIGELKTNAHGVKGTVYAANKHSFYLVGFEYDGQGPDAYFWTGTTAEPSSNGTIVPNEKGMKDILKRYNKEDIIITLPEGKMIKDVKWLSVWCKMFAVDFGSIKIPNDLVLPGELNLGPFPSFAHGLHSDSIIVRDSKTVYIPKLFYDGAAPDAFFLVGKGNQPHSSTAIKVPDENGSLQKLKGYQGRDITLKLPGELTFKDIEWLSMYCITFEENFGHVKIPQDLNIPVYIPVAESLRAEKMIQPPSNPDMAYYGKYIGELKTNAHGVKGKVYVASEDTFYLKDFSYDGQGPKGHFWAGDTPAPSPKGFIVLDELGTKEVLGEYKNRDIAIKLDDGKKMKDIKWLSVWCEQFSVDFGSIMIPEDLQPPKEESLGSLPSLAHGVKSGPVIIKDVKTIFISNLHYDGAAPDAFFLVGNGKEPHGLGTKVPDENGSLEKIKGYNGKDILLLLPGNLTVFDIEWFGLYCIMFAENFGHVRIPKDLNVPPDMQALTASSMEFDNCEEIFPDKMQVRWKIVDKDLYVQMTGKVGDKEYMAFGQSGKSDIPYMIGSDVVLVYFDKSKSQAYAVDYFLTSKSQCSGKNGVCPDTKLGGTEDSHLTHFRYNDGILQASYKKSLHTGDSQDQSIPSSDSITVVAAIGPVNSLMEAAYHPVYYTKQTIRINFGRKPPMSNCGSFNTMQVSTTPKPNSWKIHRISGETVFRAQIGPPGGDRGYYAITGQRPWGLAWWINGMLIPELIVERGKNYTFIIEGGNDPTKSASYHPLYITNNNEGGGSQFLEMLGSENHKIYAGVKTDKNGNIIPTGVGRYCEWKHKTIDMAENVSTFEEYKETLQLKCNDGVPGEFVWSPDDDTPDTVYYQCFTHRNLGSKIHVTGKNGNGSPHQIQYLVLSITLVQLLMLVI